MHSIHFPNYGVVFNKLETEQILDLKRSVDNFYKSKNLVSASKTLVGNLQQEYDFLEEIKPLQREIFACLHQYTLAFPRFIPDFLGIEDKDLEGLEFVLDSAWINFQKKHEFNPVHRHSGVFSFVIWVDIPFELVEEKRVFNKDDTSEFCFLYNDILGHLQTYNLNLDPSSEGLIGFFPAKLHHTVYPFYTTEKKRISISGNIRLDRQER